MTSAVHASADIAIGGVSVRVHTSDIVFHGMLADRYADFIHNSGAPDFDLDVEISDMDPGRADEDVRVFREGGQWRLERGDFIASWDPSARRGRVRQFRSPYAIDSVLRIVHTLLLAPGGGFLMHAASAVRDGRAYVFAGKSGAGKTTLARCAPPDVRVLSDEVSYVRRIGDGYVAHGTPFAGELGRAGDNVQAPVARLYLLRHAAENAVRPLNPSEAARALLANLLFFAEDPTLVRAVFAAAIDFAERVPVSELAFVPGAAAWDAIT